MQADRGRSPADLAVVQLRDTLAGVCEVSRLGGAPQMNTACHICDHQTRSRTWKWKHAASASY